MNRMYVYNNTTVTMQYDNTTSSINNLAIDYSLVSVVMEDIMNCVKSYIALIR